MTKVLAAGDHFVLSRLLRDAVDRAANGDHGVDVRELTLPWPLEPFQQIAEVHEASGSEDDLIAALDGVEVCVTQMAPVTERVLAASPALRLVCVGRGGPVNVNVDAATVAGVAVTSAPGRNATATAEHTVAMILAAVRRIPETHSELAAGTWRGDYYRYDQVGPEIEGSTVGLVGLGAIGRRVAGVMRALGAEVVAYDPFVSNEPDGVDVVGLDELLARANVLTLHARLTSENRGMIGRKQIAQLPPGAVIVNCARGGLLDYDAVCDALDEGRLFAAAFDVFPEEPIPQGSRLLVTPGVILTPHLAGASKETAVKAASIISQDVSAYLNGEALPHCVNPEVLKAGVLVRDGRAHVK